MMEMDSMDLGNATVTLSLDKLDSMRELITSLNYDLDELRRMIKDNLGMDHDQLEDRDRARRGSDAEIAVSNHFMRRGK